MPEPERSDSASGVESASTAESARPKRDVEAEKAAILAAVAAGRFDTIQQKVAWLLNHIPETRDSDVTLQLHFWDTFEGQRGREAFSRKDLYDLQRLTSLTRARATIQNTYGLFKAAEEVRAKRGTLSEEERQKARERRPEAPTLTVYMDESGKTGDHLIVGSLWFLFAPELFRFFQAVEAWKKANNFQGEFHFKEIAKGNLAHYLSLIDFLHSQAATISFKALSVERRGLSDISQAINQLFFLLLEKGVEHEHVTNRAELPRELSVWKDQEELSADKLFLEDLRHKLQQTSIARFEGKLIIGDMHPVTSDAQPLVQIADLYTGAINRMLNSPGGDHPKDQVAAHFLNTFGYPGKDALTEQHGDMTIHMAL